MSHRQRQRTTHDCTAQRRVQATDANGNLVTDEFDEPVYSDTPETVMEDVPVRYRPQGSAFVREDTGERVRRSPSIRGPPTMTDVQEGDRILLFPRYDGGYGLDYSEAYGGAAAFEAVGMSVVRGRHGISHVVVELEAH